MNTTRTAPVILAILSLISLNALAAKPAPWYLWKNAVDGSTHCAQASPGTGWGHDHGPFSDAHCRTALSRGDASSATGRTNKMLELMTIIVAARSAR